jgi:hypothetical protein
MNEEFLGAEVQEVADPVIENSEETTGAEVEEVADPQAVETEDIKPPKSTSDETFANMRRELEAAKAERERFKTQAEQIANAFKPYLGGETVDDIADLALSHQTGKTVDDIRRERVENQRISFLEAQAAEYQNIIITQKMQDDLKAIQKIDPEIKSLEDLGQEFNRLVSAGLSGVEAFDVIKTRKGREERKAPPKIGKVNNDTKTEKDFYTPEEVDNLQPSDYDKPGVMKKVRDSMKAWK